MCTSYHFIFTTSGRIVLDVIDLDLDVFVHKSQSSILHFLLDGNKCNLFSSMHDQWFRTYLISINCPVSKQLR